MGPNILFLVYPFFIMYKTYSSSLIWCPIIWGIQGLQDKIKLVILDRENRPAWYKEKINSADKVKIYKCKFSSIPWMSHENV